MSSKDPPGQSPGIQPEMPNRESLAPGTLVGDFEIVRVIGSGGFGTVYLALDNSLEREVAIKEFLPAQLAYRVPGEQQVTLRSQSFEASYEAGLHSFVNEAKILARFNHPAIVKVHRFWEGNGTAYMVMPFVHGATLRDARRSMKEPPTEAWLRGVLDPLLDALSMLHAEGIFHRDIAPDNILLPSAREPVLLDFGAARRVIGDRTQTFTAVLKPNYAPIEQYAEASQLRQGPWTDLYALGAVVVYMLNAVPPPPSTVRSMHDEMPLLLMNPPAGVSASFLAAVQWALAVRPQDRPQSVQQFRSALDGRIAVPMIARRKSILGDAVRGDLSTHRVDSGMNALDGGPTQQTTVAFARHGNPESLDKPQSATWDTTMQPEAAAAVAEIQPSTGDKPTWLLSSTVQERLARLRQGTGIRPRAKLIAAGIAVLCVSGAAFGLLKSRLSEPGAATWHELGRHAKSSETIIEERADESRPVPPLEVAAASAIQDTAPTASVTPASTAVLGATAAKPATMLANVVAPGATAGAVRTAKPPEKRVAVKKQRPKTAKLPLLGPREACADRNFISAAICINRKCDEPRYKRHPQCMAFAKQREESMRR